jgi:hypothetical protein
LINEVSSEDLNDSSVETLVVKEVSAELLADSSIEILVVNEASAEVLVEFSADILESIDVSLIANDTKELVRPEISPWINPVGLDIVGSEKVALVKDKSD